MNRTTAFKIGIDFLTAILMLAAMSYRVTGNLAHEITGTAVLCLFAAHITINRDWYKNLSKGKYGFRRTALTAVNLLMIFSILLLVVNAAFISRSLYHFAPSSEGMLPKQLHTLAAYWLFILVSVHLGLHWSMILNAVKIPQNRFAGLAARITAAGCAAWGVYESFSRDVGARLVMYFSFDFWDPSQPAVLFIASNFAIMSLYVWAAYYTLKAVQKRKSEPVLLNGEAKMKIKLAVKYTLAFIAALLSAQTPVCADTEPTDGLSPYEGKKILIVYYSNFGATDKLAKYIQAETGGDIFRIETTVPYPQDYDEAVTKIKRERAEGFIPEIKAKAKDIKSYDIIFIGTPVWGSTLSTPVMRFLSENDFSGKIIIPFCTYKIGPGATFGEIGRRAAGTAFVGSGFSSRDTEAPEEMKNDIKEWLKTALNR